MIEWLNLILSNIKNIYIQFLIFRDLVLYDINFTGQIIYLEHKLQTELGCNIKIIDGNYLEFLPVWNRTENQTPDYIYNQAEEITPIYEYNRSEITSYYDYIVKCDCALSPDQITKIENIVNKYKLLNKSYKIEHNG